jgi:hypothetical protein
MHPENFVRIFTINRAYNNNNLHVHRDSNQKRIFDFFKDMSRCLLDLFDKFEVVSWNQSRSFGFFLYFDSSQLYLPIYFYSNRKLTLSSRPLVSIGNKNAHKAAIAVVIT